MPPMPPLGGGMGGMPGMGGGMMIMVDPNTGHQVEPDAIHTVLNVKCRLAYCSVMSLVPRATNDPREADVVWCV
jgi:hypothetical protein